MNKPGSIAIIDGEHYLPVIIEALDVIRQTSNLEAAVFAGGTEKIAEGQDLSVLGCPVYIDEDPEQAFLEAIDTHPAATQVVDLSDEPVLDYTKRFQLISLALSKGLAYRGADFHFQPPDFRDLARKPAIAVIGTGKRVGKTAISGYLARHLKQVGRRPIVVAMGRGGPAEPEVVRGDKISIDADYLLSVSARGLHAASDYYEDALTSRVTTVGCRRCGGGMAGQPFVSNVLRGVELADSLDGDVMLLEGSGATLPPVRWDSALVVCGANQPKAHITGYLGAYRLMLADVAMIANCEEEIIGPQEIESLVQSMRGVNPDLVVVPTVFRPNPLADISGAKVFFATTAPQWVGDKLDSYLSDRFGVRVVGISHHLSNRPLLRQELAAAEGKFDVLLTELKAAAVDVATKLATDVGAVVAYCDNVPVALGEEENLREALDRLISLADDGFSDRRIGALL